MNQFQKDLDKALARHKKGTRFRFSPSRYKLHFNAISVNDVQVFASKMQSEMDDPISINIIRNRFEYTAFERLEEFVAQNAAKIVRLSVRAPERLPERGGDYDPTNLIRLWSSTSQQQQGLKEFELEVSNTSDTQSILEACCSGSIGRLEIDSGRCRNGLEAPQVRALCEQIAAFSSLKALEISHKFDDEGMEGFVDLFLSLGDDSSSLEDAELANLGGLTAASLPHLTRLLRGISVSNNLSLFLFGSPGLFADATPNVVEEFFVALQNCEPLYRLEMENVGIRSNGLVGLLQAAEKLAQPRTFLTSISITADSLAFTDESFDQLVKSLPRLLGVDTLSLNKAHRGDGEGASSCWYSAKKLWTMVEALCQNTALTGFYLDANFLYAQAGVETRIHEICKRRNRYRALLKSILVATTPQRHYSANDNQPTHHEMKTKDFPVGLWANAIAKVSAGQSSSSLFLRADPVFLILRHGDLFARSSETKKRSLDN